MSTRSVRVVLEGNNSSLVRSLSESAIAADRLNSRVENLGRNVRANEEHYTRAGTALAAMGAGTVMAMGASAAAAVSWQSDFAGVRKTVDDTASGYAALEGELRGMARTLPTTHSGIARTAEAAGQLGVKREDISGFTKVMIDLGETTDLTADQAATGMAQIMNVMGTAGEDVERFGSTLVELGNNGASTESQILDMGQRIAGAAALAGASESDVLALANAMASVGIESQLGGSAMSRAMIEMNSAVTAGGRGLENFANVAGVTASEFAETWKRDPVTAVQMFVEGLARIDEGGGDAAAALEGVGLKGTENAQVFLRLTGASDLLTESIAMGREEWDRNTALADEAGKRYETVASKLKVARNNVVDMGISLGETFLPAIGAAAELGADFAGWVATWPDPLRQATSWLGLAAGGLSLMAGGTMILVPRLLETYTAFQKIGLIGPRTTGAIKGITGALTGGWGLALAGATIAVGLWAAEQAKANARAEELAATLDEQTGALSKNSEEWFAAQLADDGTLDAAEKLGLSLETVTQAAMGNTDAIAEMNRHIEATVPPVEAGQRGLSGLQQAARKVKGAVEENNGVLADAREKLRLKTEALGAATRSEEALAAETARLTGQAEAYEAQTKRVTDSLSTYTSRTERATAVSEEAAEAVADWKGEMAGIDAGFVNLSGALQAMNDEARTWAEEQAAATGDTTDSWQDFVKQHGFSLDEYLDNLEEMVEAQQEWETNMLALSGRVSEEMLDELARLGPEGAPLVAALVDASDEELARAERLFGQRGGAAAGAFSDALFDAGPVLRAVAAKLGQDAAREIAQQIADGEVTVAEVVDEYELEALVNVGANTENYELSLGVIIGKTEDTEAEAHITAEDSEAERRLKAWAGRVNQTRPVAHIDAEDSAAERKRLGWVGAVERTRPVAHIDAEDSGADRERTDWRDRVGRTTGTAHIDAETRLADEAMVGFFRRHDGKVLKVGMEYSYNSGGGYADGGIIQRADGGLDQYGRSVPRVPQMGGPAYGRTNVLWGEPETGWEAYISGKPSMRSRNLRVLDEVARRLGLSVIDTVKPYAAGGFNPRDPWIMKASMTGSASPWIDAMEDNARKWAASQRSRGGVNYGGPYGWNPNGMFAGEIIRLIKSLVPNAVITSTLRPGAITASGVPSLHGLGRAVDWYVPGMGAAMIAAYHRVGAARRWSQHFYTPAGRGAQQGYWDATIGRTHVNHAHTAMAAGGLLDNTFISARLGEHVLTEREVEALGGHRGVYAMRRALASGALLGSYDVGGAVGSPYSERARELAPRLTSPAPRAARPAPVVVSGPNGPVAIAESSIREFARLVGAELVAANKGAAWDAYRFSTAPTGRRL